MPIDLPASSQIGVRGNQNPVIQAANQRQEAVQTALRTLNIKAGETATAEVKTVKTVDESLRARLISLAYPVSNTAETGLARSTNASTPSAALNSDSLMSLLKSASLKLVELEIKGKALLAFTDRPLKTGAQVSVESQKSGLLLLPQDPKTTANNNPQGSLKNTQQLQNSSALYSKGGPAGTLNSATSQIQGNELHSSLQKTRFNSSLNSLQLTTLQRELRSLLPKQDANKTAITEILNSANLISNLVRQPNNSALREQLPASVQESLKIVASHLRSAEHLSQPSTLKKALFNSGMQLEQRLLSKAALTNATNSNSPIDLTGARNNELGKILARQDLKAALLYLLNQLPSSGGALTASQNNPSESLILILQQFIGRVSKNQKRNPQNSRELLQSIQQLTTKALGKLAFQQLQSLQRTQISADGTPTQHWQLEIPIRYGHEVQHFSLRIHEEWVNEQQSNDSETTEKVRQWFIKLAFELPEAGTFHAHLVIVDDSVSASLWAEEPETLNKSRQKLGLLQKRLEEDGVQVTKIECFPGKPVEEKIQLNYSLVDIKT